MPAGPGGAKGAGVAAEHAPGPQPKPPMRRYPDPAQPFSNSPGLAPSPQSDPGSTSPRERRGRKGRRQPCPRYLRGEHAAAVTTIAARQVPFLVTEAATAEQLTLTTNYSLPPSPPRAPGRSPSPPASPPPLSPAHRPSARAHAVAPGVERARAGAQALQPPLPCHASVPQE